MNQSISCLLTEENKKGNMKKLKNPKALFLDYSQTIDDVYENSKKTLTQQRKGECQ